MKLKKNSRIHVAREKVSRQNHYKYKGCRGLKIQLPRYIPKISTYLEFDNTVVFRFKQGVGKSKFLV